MVYTDMHYYIYCRYEFWGKNGKEFSKWYRHINEYDTEAEAKEYLKICKENSKGIDKVTKLKHEYEIRYIDKTLFYQSKMHAGKGRYKKVSNEMLDDILKNLYKSKTGITEIPAEYAPYIYNTESYVTYLKDGISKKYKNEYIGHIWYDNKISGTPCYLMLKDKNTIIGI